MENVPEVIGSDNLKHFQKWEQKLSEFGYTNHIKIINSKNYGIPQNRRRCFMVSILNGNFEFGGSIPLKYKLKDFLEVSVDEKYYLTEKMFRGMIKTKFNSYKLENRLQDIESCVDTLTTSTGDRCPHLVAHDTLKRELCQQLIDDGLVQEGDIVKHSYTTQIMSGKKKCIEKSNEMIALTTRGDCVGVVVKDEDLPNNKILIKNVTKQGYLEAESGDGIDISGRMEYHRRTVQKGISQTLSTAGGNDVGVCVCDTKRYKNYLTWRNKKGEFNTECNRASLEDDLALTIPTKDQTKVALIRGSKLRIRKLTSKECIRLMGFQDKDYQCMKQTNLSDSAIYHCAGDSIVVSCLMMIFSKLFNDDGTYIKQINDYVETIKEK